MSEKAKTADITAATTLSKNDTTKTSINQDNLRSSSSNISLTNADYNVKSRINEAKEFLDLLFVPVTMPKFSYLWIKKGETKKTIPFDVSNPQNRLEMAKQAISYNDNGYDVYLGVCLMDKAPMANNRAKSNDITLQTAIWTDIDIESTAHKSSEKEKLAPDFNTARGFLPFAASIIISSGYGLHGYNLLDTPLEINDNNRNAAKDRNKKYIDIIRKNAGEYKIDGVADLARVLRVPGTYNFKLGRDNAPLCHIVNVNDIRYSLDKFDNLNTPAQVQNSKTPDKIIPDPLEDDYQKARALEMLRYIDADDYETWVKIGMDLKDIGLNCQDWDDWSSKSHKYKEGECFKKWSTFTGGGNVEAAIGSLCNMAKAGGYDDKAFHHEYHDKYKNINIEKAINDSPNELESDIEDEKKEDESQEKANNLAIETLRNVTDFSNENIFNEKILRAAAVLNVYVISEFANFREKCKGKNVPMTLFDEKVRRFSKPIQAEKDRREQQRWIKLKENEYKRKQQEREQKRLKDIELLEKLANDKNADKEKIVNLIHSSLERDHKGKLLNNTRNFNLIIYNDPYLKGCVGFDAFSYRMVPMRALPWSDKLITDVAWRDSDDSGMQNYIDSVYNLRSDKVFKDAIDEYAHKHSFHPIRDFFNNLPEWDGTPRAENYFIDSLNVKDTKYARNVTKKWLIAAVARVFHPGCKWDYCLALKSSKQGTGKSSSLARLGGKWFNDSISDITNKDALEALLGNWIIEIGEMQATKRADNEAIKSFMSRQVDKFRKSYGRRTEEYPRQCIFAATTNSEEFLKDRTGGRRFLILVSNANDSDTKQRLAKFDKKYITQLWAEVYHLYNELFKNGFDSSLLDVDDEIKLIAKNLQSGYTEGAGLEGMVIAYLNRPVPNYWQYLSKQDRRKWIQGEIKEIDSEHIGVDKLEPEDKSKTSIKLRGEVYRGTVCAIEFAYEELKIDDPGKARPTLKEINEIIAHLPDWIKVENRSFRTSAYGQQRLSFKRK